MAKQHAVPQEKRANIYKVTTTIQQPGGNEHLPVERVDYVRAKTKAGAAAMIAERYITVELPSTDDLLKLAGITTISKG